MNPLKILVVILVIIVMGTVALLATGIWNPSWNPFSFISPKSPEAVMGKMVKTMADVNTVSSQGEMYFEAREEKLMETVSMAMAFSADSDETDPENPKAAMGLDFDLLLIDQDFSFSLQAKVIGQTIYLKITEIPDLPDDIIYELERTGFDINQLLNEWIRIDEESLKNAYEAMGLDFTEVEEMLEESKKYEELIEEIAEEFTALIEKRTPDLLKIKEVLPDKKIDGVEVYHYVVVLDKEGVKKTVPELIEIFEKMFLMGLEQQKDEWFSEMLERQWEESKKEMLAGLDEGLDYFFERAGEFSAELWIGKEDYYLYKIKFEKLIDINKFDPREEITLRLGFDMNYSNFNQPIIIEPPQDYKTLDEILIYLLQFSMDYYGPVLFSHSGEVLFSSDLQSRAPEAQVTALSSSLLKSFPQLLQASLFKIPF